MVYISLHSTAEFVAGGGGSVASVIVDVGDGLDGGVAVCLGIFGAHLVWMLAWVVGKVEGPNFEKFPPDEEGERA